MLQENFERIRQRVLRLLGKLDPLLTYHDISHTLDVVEQCERIARLEKVDSERDIFLLKVAGMYHDTGFLYVYQGHEERGCQIFMEDSVDDELTPEEKDLICALIRVTKIPQMPSNLLEEIICDADLDYLGRPDFEEISLRLKAEFLAFGIIQTEPEYDKLQINFLGNHHYHTRTSQRQREPLKSLHYRELTAS